MNTRSIIYGLGLIVGAGVLWTVATSQHDDHFFVAMTALATVAIALMTIWAIDSQVATAKSVSSVQILLQLIDRFESQEMLAKRDRLAMLLIGNGAVMTADAEGVLDFFETVGHLVRRSAVDVDMVDNGFSIYLRYYWTALTEFVEQRRRAYDDPTIYEDAEWLNKAFAKRERTNGRSENIEPGRLDEFLRSETKVIVPRP